MGTGDEQLLDAPRDVCRVCGGRLVPVVFGFPGAEMWEAAERGEIVLGGCLVPDRDGWPRGCADCRRRRTARRAEEPPY